MASSASLAGEYEGTFSIAAYDSLTGELGVAVQSRAFSVGSSVAWAEAGVGAIATQARTNQSFGPWGLALLRGGADAASTLRELLELDPEREQRQIGIVDARGGSVAFTGDRCMDWAGHLTAPGLSVQGNILASGDVAAVMIRAYEASRGELSERLLAALHAAQAAGGDRRGQQSAALLVVRPSELFPEYRFRYVDLRVEDHATPIAELERLFRIHQAGSLLRAHLRFAALYDSIGEGTAAQREWDRIGDALDAQLAAEVPHAGSLNAIAWYLASAGVRLEESLTAAERAASMEPDNPEILDTLAEVLFRLGRRDEALAVMDRALARSPEDLYLREQRSRMETAPFPPRRGEDGGGD